MRSLKILLFIEYVWRKADDEVLNVLDTTVLEGISENLPMWTDFGNCIHEDFRTYINTVLIRQNIMMSDVPPLC